MAIPGSIVAVGKLVTPGGAQGPLGPTGSTGPPGPSGGVPGSIRLRGFRSNTGNVPNWYALEYANVVLFGADPTGTADSAPAINAAIAEVNVAGIGGTIFFPAGTYKILTQIVVTLKYTAPLCLMGAGQDVTVLYWPNATNGFVITQDGSNPCTVSDMTLTSGSTSGGTALWFTFPSYITGHFAPATNVFNCSFRGQTWGFNQGWAIGMVFDRVPQVSIYNCLMLGPSNNQPWTMTGVYFVGSSTGISTAFTIFSLTTYFTDRSVYCADYIQGLMMTACDFTACNYGVFASCPAELQYQVSIFNSQINANTYCIYLNNVALCMIVGNVLSNGNSVNNYGIVLSACSGITVIGNTIAADVSFTGQYVGITLTSCDGSTYPIVIDSNSFGYVMTYGVIIGANCKGVTVGRSNAFGPNVAYKILNQSAGSPFNNYVSGQHLDKDLTLSGAGTLLAQGAATISSTCGITVNSTLTFDGLAAGSKVYLRVANSSGAARVLKMNGANPAPAYIIGKSGGGEVDLVNSGVSIPNGASVHFQGMFDGNGTLFLQYL